MNRWLTEQRIQCPFCAEPITILLDASSGSQDYIEDCQVCCRPIRIVLDADSGEIENLRVDCAS